MAVDNATVRARIKLLLETLTGVGTVYSYMPRGLQEADCPAFVLIAGESELGFAFNMGQRVLRFWRLLLFLGQAAAGVYGDLEAKADPFFERVEDLFAANLKLNDLDVELVSAVLVSDTGPATVIFPVDSTQRWVVCEWELAVLSKRAVTTGT